MRDINSIVDFEKHPINDNDYIKKCNALIKKNSLLVLENFLLIDSLEKILKETKSLEDKAFYCMQKHTILLNKKSEKLDKDDPYPHGMSIKKDKIWISDANFGGKMHSNTLMGKPSFNTIDL